MKSIILGTISLALLGCGGGGSDDSPTTASESSPPASTETIPVQPIETYVDNRTMSDLSISNNFSYTNSVQQEISFQISSVATDQAYVSVYSDYQSLASGGYQPQRNSKVVSGQLIAGALELSFALNSGTESFLAEVWILGEQDPLQQVIAVGDHRYWVE